MPFAKNGCSIAASIALVLVTGVPGSASNPLEPPSTGGVVALHRLLSRLDVHRRLLVVGAHPDDEDTSLLALVARGMGGEAAYLSLSRGEGGQNLIGPELGVDLGLLRSQELLAARRIDGARQYFTRAFDFGYTRSLEETLERWPREVLLEDVVRVVRRFKPQVVVSVFPADGGGGHGQHQAAGVVAHEAFDAAGDTGRFPGLADEGLFPWRPAVLYRSSWFRPQPSNLVLETGDVDPATGKTYHQLAMASRSQHRSQDMGMLQDTGQRATRVEWVAGAARDEDLFAGVDTRLEAIAALLPEGPEREELAADLRAVTDAVRSLRGRLVAGRPEVGIPRLREIVAVLQDAGRRLAASGLAREAALVAGGLVAEKLELAEEALAVASGLVFDAVTDSPVLVTGESAVVVGTFYNSGPQPVLVSAHLHGPAGWELPPAAESREVPPGASESWDLSVEVPAEARPSVPYFLRRPLRGDLYDWSDVAPEIRGEPFAPAPLGLVFAVESDGVAMRLEREVVHRFRDQVAGEQRRPLRVVSPLDLSVAPRQLVWPLASSAARSLRVELRRYASAELSGRLEVTEPPGWPAIAGAPFRLDGGRESVTIELGLERPPGAAAGVDGVTVVAVLDDGRRIEAAHPVIDYAHIRPVPSARPARVAVRSLELELPPVDSVGYVRGASDGVPESLAEVGLPLRLLGSGDVADMAADELQRFDAIIVGSRAYESDAGPAQANERLLDYVRRGGLLLVQYQQYGFARGELSPYPIDIARPHDRITDERSPVEILEPRHAAFARPHRIGEEDWQGWVQERGLYFAHSWDEAFQPLLRMQDPGMPPQDGALLVAPYGEGTYVYTGLAFFRQLPAGVPGAFRLFMNLLSLGSGEGEGRISMSSPGRRSWPALVL